MSETPEILEAEIAGLQTQIDLLKTQESALSEPAAAVEPPPAEPAGVEPVVAEPAPAEPVAVEPEVIDPVSVTIPAPPKQELTDAQKFPREMPMTVFQFGR